MSGMQEWTYFHWSTLTFPEYRIQTETPYTQSSLRWKGGPWIKVPRACIGLDLGAIPVGRNTQYAEADVGWAEVKLATC